MTSSLLGASTTARTTAALTAEKALSARAGSSEAARAQCAGVLASEMKLRS